MDRPGEHLLPLPPNGVGVPAERLWAHQDPANILDEILVECGEDQADKVEHIIAEGDGRQHGWGAQCFRSRGGPFPGRSKGADHQDLAW